MAAFVGKRTCCRVFSIIVCDQTPVNDKMLVSFSFLDVWYLGKRILSSSFFWEIRLSLDTFRSTLMDAALCVYRIWKI